MIYEHTSYRSYIKEVLAERVEKNPKYSLRAMAAQLGFAHSTLSEVMKGSANLSLGLARKMAAKLELSSKETEFLCLLIQFESTVDPEIRESLYAQIKSLSPKKIASYDLSVDQFKQISEWYHSAILEMVHLNKFHMTPASVAKKLGISKIEAEVAMERLVRLELLEKNKEGRFTLVHGRLLTNSNAQTNIALRKFFRQMLQKASESLETQTPKQRVSGYETIAFSPEALAEAKETIEKFFSEMIALGRRHPVKKDVYHLLVHFFNLTSGKE